VQMRKFKWELLNLGGTTSTSTNADNLLRRHQNQDSGELHGNPLDGEVRLRMLAALSGVDQRTRGIYLAFRSGYTYTEIAAAWDVSFPVIKECVARALLAIMES
jgi:DNA-directed RNA polymerase specialized sigma24 family protein